MRLVTGNILFCPRLGELTILPRGALLLSDDGTIRDVLPSPPENFGAQRYDYGDALVMPSFVDMHLHAPQYPMLGTGMDLPLLEWLDACAFPAEARFADTDYARRVYRRLAAELLSLGTTRVCMFSSLHCDATLALMEELERAGVAGYVGKVNMDRGGSLHETTRESQDETLRWLDGCTQFRLVHPILTPRFTPSCSDELMAWLGALARERNLRVQSHLSESRAELAFVRELRPECAQYWETYASCGLWKHHTVMAHCVYSDEREREAMREHGVVAAHCPDSNINLRSGIAPVRAMLREGVWVTLGSDIAGGAVLAMNRVAAEAIRVSKLLDMDAGEKSLSAEEAFFLATTAGHQYFGADGGFASGAKLHAIVVDDQPFEGMALRARFERALYRMEPDWIRAVWSEGRLVKE